MVLLSTNSDVVKTTGRVGGHSPQRRMSLEPAISHSTMIGVASSLRRHEKDDPRSAGFEKGAAGGKRAPAPACQTHVALKTGKCHPSLHRLHRPVGLLYPRSLQRG